MKQIEKLILVTCVLVIATLIVQFGGSRVLPWVVNNTGVDHLTAFKIKGLVDGLFRLAVPLAIAVWMYVVARRDQSSPWIWVLLALVYQFLAPILYFALKIYRSLPSTPVSQKVEP